MKHRWLPLHSMILTTVLSPVSQHTSVDFYWFYSYSYLIFLTKTSWLTTEILKTSASRDFSPSWSRTRRGFRRWPLHKWNGTAKISLKETSQGAVSNFRAVLTHSSTDTSFNSVICYHKDSPSIASLGSSTAIL